jgi:hypothetical protein
LLSTWNLHVCHSFVFKAENVEEPQILAGIRDGEMRLGKTQSAGSLLSTSDYVSKKLPS